ncbi:MAG: hypothetical protein L3V56_07350 [Candidatus Magnetoovum sp. WYHC-5]|nr:hypothetical protein [Candidatus Magnetoovum sp. WYHC-5]
MGKPKGPTPSLISGSNGKPSMAIAGKERMCVRCKSKITKGDRCFEIPKVTAGFSSKKPFCQNCFRDILDKTEADLEECQKLMDNKILDIE